jgi:hypothetical protein
MKLLLILTVLLVGCDSTESVVVDTAKITQTFVDNKIRFVKVDNCEYIVTSFQPLLITHKGNCTNHK